jgi:hypothetical protein
MAGGIFFHASLGVLVKVHLAFGTSARIKAKTTKPTTLAFLPKLPLILVTFLVCSMGNFNCFAKLK